MTQATGTTTGTESDSSAQNNSQQENPQQGDGATPVTYETWYSTQADDVKALVDGRLQSLHSALQSERSSRADLEKKLRDAAKGQKEGSAEAQNLTTMADELAVANRRADFYEAAVKPEVNAQDLEALWVLANAKADEYFDRRGNVNFALLKERHPGLFRQAPRTPPANAGNGAGGQAATNGANMNSIIRRAAGRE